MIKIRQLRKGDIEYVKQNPLEDAVVRYPEINPDPETTYTALWNGEIVGVGGVTILWEGVGDFWIILSKNAERDGVHGIIALSAISQRVDKIIKKYKLHRAQAAIRTNFPRAIKMIEYLGFEREGLLRGYCPDGGDVWMYAKLNLRRTNND